MHVPDGFIDAPVSAVAGLVAAGAVAVSLKGARRELAADGGGERTAPLAGLVAAFIFAVQMLNFPVAAGTSGHLLGGALAAILVGPFTGVLCVSVVLLLQGVLFADGGLTALGVNISDMALVTTVVAYLVFRGLVKVLPRGRRSITVASFAAALLSVPAAAVAFTLIYAVGGTTDVSIGKVATAMIGVHVLIGVGEAVITALTVGAVVAVRPDLVYGARGLTAPLKLRVGGELVDAPAAEPVAAAPRSHRKVWLAGLAASLVLAGFVSFYASADPDGLEKVAHDKGIDKGAEEHASADSPLADYGVKDVTDARLSGGLAGVIGVGVTVVAGSAVFWTLRRRRTPGASPATVPDAQPRGASRAAGVAGAAGSAASPGGGSAASRTAGSEASPGAESGVSSAAGSAASRTAPAEASPVGGPEASRAAGAAGPQASPGAEPAASPAARSEAGSGVEPGVESSAAEKG